MKHFGKNLTKALLCMTLAISLSTPSYSYVAWGNEYPNTPEVTPTAQKPEQTIDSNQSLKEDTEQLSDLEYYIISEEQDLAYGTPFQIPGSATEPINLVYYGVGAYVYKHNSETGSVTIPPSINGSDVVFVGLSSEEMGYTLDYGTTHDSDIVLGEISSPLSVLILDCMTLKYLNCAFNNLEQLDISRNTSLEYCACYENSLTDLDVSSNINLKTLKCSENQISSLDVSMLTNLEHLFCSYNQLPRLDLSNSHNIQSLYCINGKLQEINLKNCTNLKRAYLYGNQLIDLDISDCKNLHYLKCNENDLTTLSVDDNPFLKIMDCTNNYIANTKGLFAWAEKPGCTGSILPQKLSFATKLSVVTSSNSIKVGESKIISASVIPTKASQDVTWTSSDVKIASIDVFGKIKGERAGTCTITATTTDGSNISENITITVISSVKITKATTANTHGSITIINSSNGLKATMYPKPGDPVTLKSNPQTGFTLTRISYTTASGKTFAIKRTQGSGKAGTSSTYRFFMPNEEVTINAMFDTNARTITKNIAGSGKLTIIPSYDSAKATLYPQVGNRVLVKATPAAGYKLTKINYTNNSTGKAISLTKESVNTRTYYFIMPNDNVSLNAVFAPA